MVIDCENCKFAIEDPILDGVVLCSEFGVCTEKTKCDFLKTKPCKITSREINIEKSKKHL